MAGNGEKKRFCKLLPGLPIQRPNNYLKSDDGISIGGHGVEENAS